MFVSWTSQEFYPTSEHFLGHAIAVFGRGIEVVPRDVVEVEGFPEDVLDGIWGKGEFVRKQDGGRGIRSHNLRTYKR